MKRLDPKIVFFVLLLAVTMPPLVPGQQYTGVKSVESSDSAEGDAKPPGKADRGGTAGISARSIDKFEANELPDSDSKIIKLSIKQVEPQVTSGSRGARNLGFSADVSLNAIPGGLNNELTNGDFKFPVTPSTTVAKDSYGNPVTPYTDLGTTGLESVGFVQDGNRDTLHGPNVNQHGHYNYKLPSYASGIIEPVLLPPVASVNFVPQQSQPSQFPQSSVTTRSPTTAFQFVPNAKIPTIEDAQIPFAQKPLNGLIPPVFPGEQLPGYKVDVGTERSPIFAKDPFGSPSLDKGLTLPRDQPPVNFNQGAPQNSQVPLQVPLSIPPLAPQQPQASQQPQPQVPQQHQYPHQSQYHPTIQSQQTPQQPQFKPTQAPVQKFTGSFGGAPGFLGSQQNLGTAYTSTPQPIKPASPQTYPTPPTTHFQPSVPQSPAPTKAPNKFTGSFGGAPGFLGNQQNLGTAYKPTSPTIPQRPVSFQPQPQPQPQYPQTQAPNIIRPPSPFQPPQQPSYPPQQPTQASGGTYTGTFTQQHNNHHHQQQPQPQAPVTQRPGLYVGNKFTGSFGGAPGLLGNQKQPGSHVKPDGTILPPSGPGIGFSSTTGSSSRPTSVAVVSSGATFTGSFGGPPGVLRPFDNVNG